MEPATRAEPSAVAEFLELHQLGAYAQAFDEEGWDSLPQLLTITVAALEQLIVDVKMKRAATHSACVTFSGRTVLRCRLQDRVVPCRLRLTAARSIRRHHQSSRPSMGMLRRYTRS